MKLIYTLLGVVLATPAAAKSVEVPIEIGLGPTALMWTGPIAQDQVVHYGISVSAAAVLDKKFLKQNRKLIPKQYRKQVLKMEEIRIGHFLVPDTLIISPKTHNTGMYGATWSPLTLQVPLSGYFKANADLLLTYAYIHSDNPDIGNTHFLRPGLGLGLEFTAPLGDRFSLGAGWRSNLYVPQELNSTIGSLGPIETGDLSQSNWHVGQASVRIHYRFPFRTNL